MRSVAIALSREGEVKVVVEVEHRRWSANMTTATLYLEVDTLLTDNDASKWRNVTRAYGAIRRPYARYASQQIMVTM